MVTTWHTLEAEGCEATKKWDLVVFHLSRLIEAQRAQPLLYARRARAHAELHQWEQSLSDYNKAVAFQDVFSGDAEERWQIALSYSLRGLALERGGRREEAEQVFRKAIADFAGLEDEFRNRLLHRTMLQRTLQGLTERLSSDHRGVEAGELPDGTVVEP